VPGRRAPGSSRSAAAVVPPGTRLRSSSDSRITASMSRLSRPTAANRLTPGREPGTARGATPRAELGAGERALRETKREIASGRADLGQASRRDFSGSAQPLRATAAAPAAPGAGAPQAARPQVILDRHRQEKLALGKAQHRLVAAQQPQVPRRVCPGGSASHIRQLVTGHDFSVSCRSREREAATALA
jgi:hypothetical protein